MVPTLRLVFPKGFVKPTVNRACQGRLPSDTYLEAKASNTPFR